MAWESLFWARWMRNTIRKVMMVVAVLMTSCQVSKLSHNGRLAAQTTIRRRARRKAAVDPDQSVALRAIRAANDSCWEFWATVAGVRVAGMKLLGVGGRGGPGWRPDSPSARCNR